MAGGIAARAMNKLSDAQVRSFIQRTRQAAVGGKLADGGGLHLKVTPAGTAVWRIKYRFNGKEQLYAGIGSYPEVSLEAARAEREQLRAQLREGRNPTDARRLRRADAVAAAADTFESVARAWLASQKPDWSAVHYEKSERAIERDVLPRLGKLPVSEITPAMVTSVVKSITARGARDTASKILQHIGGIFRSAQAHGLCRDNPATATREILPRRKEQKRRPAFLKWDELGDVLRKAETARLSPAVRLAHRLCAFTAARISNVVQAEWREFDLTAEVPTWTIPRKKMKAQGRGHDHKIILGATIAADLRAWHALTGGKGLVFPSPAAMPVGSKHITRESLEKVYRITLGLEDKHTPHGWRAALSTLARDHGFERDVVELTLDHIHDNEVVRAYDRGERLEQRMKLMNWWDAQLAQAQRGADVMPITREAA